MDFILTSIDYSKLWSLGNFCVFASNEYGTYSSSFYLHLLTASFKQTMYYQDSLNTKKIYSSFRRRKYLGNSTSEYSTD